MKTARWIMFSPENGGIVRLNVAETIGVGLTLRVLPGQDIDVPLDTLAPDAKQLVLDCFASLASSLNAEPAPVTAKVDA